MSSRYQDHGYIIWDVRNGNVIPAIGRGDDPATCVYDKAAADALAKSLNDMALRNTMPALVGAVTATEGPFYVRTATLRGQLQGRKRV